MERVGFYFSWVVFPAVMTGVLMSAHLLFQSGADIMITVVGPLLGAWVFLTLLFAVLSPLLRREPVARFWALGMVLSLIPICATFPMDRLLFFVGLGAAGLLAQFLAVAFGVVNGSWRPGTKERNPADGSASVVFRSRRGGIEPPTVGLEIRCSIR